MPEQPSEMAVRDQLAHTILYHAGGFPEKAKKAANEILAEFTVKDAAQHEAFLETHGATSFAAGVREGRAEVIAAIRADIERRRMKGHLSDRTHTHHNYLLKQLEMDVRNIERRFEETPDA